MEEKPKGKWHAQNRWNHGNRAKRRAQAVLRAALRKGEVKRGCCEFCGSLRVDGHHADYSLPLQVTWLCRKHHQKLHADLRRSA